MYAVLVLIPPCFCWHMHCRCISMHASPPQVPAAPLEVADMRHVRLRTSSLDAAASRRQQRRPGSRATELMFVSNGEFLRSPGGRLAEPTIRTHSSSCCITPSRDQVTFTGYCSDRKCPPLQATTTACVTGWGGRAAPPRGSTPMRLIASLCAPARPPAAAPTPRYIRSLTLCFEHRDVFDSVWHTCSRSAGSAPCGITCKR
jgi:hypothetical protein